MRERGEMFARSDGHLLQPEVRPKQRAERRLCARNESVEKFARSDWPVTAYYFRWTSVPRFSGSREVVSSVHAHRKESVFRERRACVQNGSREVCVGTGALAWHRCSTCLAAIQSRRVRN